jgi:ribosomal protein L11 methyltransferase
LGKFWPALEIHVPACDPQLHELVLAELDDFQPTAIQEADDSSRLRAFFSGRDARDAAARALSGSFGSNLFVESLDVEDQDWAARSQAGLQALTVGRIVVAPPWDKAVGDTHQERGQTPLLVLITPSMGFGTGHHATTRLALKALQELPLEHRTVIDIGCGSGVLAIAALRLGARSAVAIDIDPDALGNARENAELNALGDRLQFVQADFRDMSLQGDVVVANLTGALVERSAETLASLVEPHGWLVASGFLESERQPVVQALEDLLGPGRIDQEDEWMCGVFKRS